MRAKKVNEQQEFERGRDPKEAMGIGLEKPTKNQIIDLLVDTENWEAIDIFVNETLDVIYNKYPLAKAKEAVEAIEIAVAEALDNWYQTTEAE